MTRDRVLLIIGLGTFFAAALYFMTGKSPYPAIGIGAVAALLVYALWSLPGRRKEPADSDRLRTTGRAMAGGNPPEAEKVSLKLKRDKRKRRKKKR